MANILVIGDSISMGYLEEVQRKLADVAEVVHNPGNGGDSANVLANLDAWLAETEPDLVSLNCGLHDLKRQPGTRTYQVPIEAYRANLVAVLARLRAARCHVVWVATTPVLDERHQARKPFDRYNADVIEYNAMARALAEEAELAVIDLYQAALELGLETALGPDGVHFTPEAYDALGRVVAAGLREHLA